MDELSSKSLSGAKPKGRPAKISPQQIISVALDVLDEDGIGFSVRKVAKRLDTGASTLYNHFRNRNGLLEAMAEAALEDIWVDCEAGGQWQVQLERWANDFRRRLCLRPSLMHLFDLALISAPALKHIRRLAAVVQGSGISFGPAIREAEGLIWFVIGSVLLELPAAHSKLDARKQQLVEDPDNKDVIDYITIASHDGYEKLWRSGLERNIAGIQAKAAGF